MIQPFFVFSDAAFFILRVVLGFLMISHGFPKLRALSATGKKFAEMGFRPGKFWAFISGVAECIGGIFLVAGFLVQPVALVLAIQFFVILLKVKKFKNIEKYEYDLALFASFLVLATVGGGIFSLDEFLGLFFY